MIPMISWVVERVLSLKMLNIDGSTDPYGYLGQICQCGGQKVKFVFIFPKSISRFVALLYAVLKTFLFVPLSFYLAISFCFLLFAFCFLLWGEQNQLFCEN